MGLWNPICINQILRIHAWSTVSGLVQHQFLMRLKEMTDRLWGRRHVNLQQNVDSPLAFGALGRFARTMVKTTCSFCSTRGSSTK
jgi:hypothetical protein